MPQRPELGTDVLTRNAAKSTSEWRVGRDLPLPFATIAVLARNLSGKVADWDEAFKTPDVKYRNMQGMGPQRVEELKRYREWIEGRHVGQDIPISHLVEVLPTHEERGLLRKPMFIDGTPFVFIDGNTNRAMEEMLASKYVRSPRDRYGLGEGQIPKAVAYLNRAFNLDFTVDVKPNPNGELVGLRSDGNTNILIHSFVLDVSPLIGASRVTSSRGL